MPVLIIHLIVPCYHPHMHWQQQRSCYIHIYNTSTGCMIAPCPLCMIVDQPQQPVHWCWNFYDWLYPGVDDAKSMSSCLCRECFGCAPAWLAANGTLPHQTAHLWQHRRSRVSVLSCRLDLLPLLYALMPLPLPLALLPPALLPLALLSL